MSLLDITRLSKQGKKKNSNPHFYAARMIHKVESFSTQEYPEERSLQKQ